MREIAKTIITFFLSLVFLTGCEKAADWYIGIPLQPDFQDKQFERGMNIFGILRPDFSQDKNNSFIYIQQVIPAVGDTITEWEILDSRVEVTSGGLSTPFSINIEDSLAGRFYYRPNEEFVPEPGKTYTLSCISPDLPVLEGRTCVPGKPVIPEGSVYSDKNNIRFTILSDTSCYLLDIYLVAGMEYLSLRTVPETGGITAVEFSSVEDISHGTIMVYSYDRNLASYYITSNISVNFNKFKKPYSTVKGGYGVFGALNSNELSY